MRVETTGRRTTDEYHKKNFKRTRITAKVSGKLGITFQIATHPMINQTNLLLIAATAMIAL